MAEVDTKGKGHVSEPELENQDIVKNANTDTAASGDLFKSGGEEKGEENKKEENGLSALGENSSKSDASEAGKLNVEVPVVISGGEAKGEEAKKEEKDKAKVGNTPTTPGKNLRKRKRKRGPKAGKNAEAGTATAELGKLIVAEGGEKKEENKQEENKEEQNDKVGEKSRKRKRKKATNSVPTKDTDKNEISTKDGDGKKVDSMGMIFMCSSKTKPDCFRYSVLGLPAAKKDLVAKIYKGMRLFLFDIDLKLLYGIYKAAGPGGYNLEPKAFKSAFPSQVRFSVMDDCLPLPEEKFKAVIKDNYFGKNKFDCQLKAEQVKNLCKLFKTAANGPVSKPVGRARKTEAHSIVDSSKERRQGQDRERRQGADRERRLAGDRERRRGGDRERQQGRDRERRPAHRRLPMTDGVYGRAGYALEILPSRPPPPLPLPATYAYERPLDMDYYRRDAPLERQERRLVDMEIDRRGELSYRDPLGYRDAPPAPEPHLSYHDPPLSYREPLYPPASYQEPGYTRAPPPAHEPALTYLDPVYARAPPPTYHSAPAYRY